MRYVICYDIADDRRREDIATLLSGYGPRVQLSVFECDIPSRREAADLQAKLRMLVDPVEDQVRLYPLDVLCVWSPKDVCERISGAPHRTGGGLGRECSGVPADHGKVTPRLP